jgi:1-acyl-sn-glycerol-3-phosphate acyltransferase
VANHGIAAPWELLVILLLMREHRPDVRVRVMTHRIWERWGPLWRYMGAFGCIPATQEGARQALAQGDAVLVFPGGIREETRPFWRWDRVDLCARVGWARIAAQSGVPVVPLALLGSQRVNPPLLQWSGFAYLSGARLFGLRDMPLTLAQVLASACMLAVLWWWASLPVAAAIAWVTLWSPLLVFVPLLPVRIQVACGEPIRPPRSEEPESLQRTYAEVNEQLAAMLVGLRAER